MRLAIMQPTYLPWAGYFGLMQSVDVFVLLDSVQFARRSWQQRNRIMSPSGAMWLTVPVRSKGRFDQPLSLVEIDRTGSFERKHASAIELNYCKAPFFADYKNIILDALRRPDPMLTGLTVELIHVLRQAIGIRTRVMLASDLDVTGHKAYLLAAIAEQLGATTYVSPPGSREYLEPSSVFADLGIGVTYFEFAHPVYSQRFPPFTPYLSVIDMLFNCGPATLPLIVGGSVEAMCRAD